jgi:hypothetical protein
VSNVRVSVSGRLTAFHASEAGGLVICVDASALDGLDLDEINRMAPGVMADVTIEAEIEDGREAES